MSYFVFNTDKNHCKNFECDCDEYSTTSRVCGNTCECSCSYCIHFNECKYDMDKNKL